MSVLKKLQISGIRSFDPSDSNAQIINFSTPITLIVGQNGCGKTTIIEALRYAITNVPPPGSNMGRSFVNDPKMTSNPEVLGKIVLEIHDNTGNVIQCTKRMKLTQARSKLTFQRLEGVIRFQGKDGNWKEWNSKCIDLNNEMCRYMGVSEAILTHVIFCHQEDSCWPLDEGKQVKERFDAIFNTTGYMASLKLLDDKDKELAVQLKTEREAYKYAEAAMEMLRKRRRELETKSADVAAAATIEKTLRETLDDYIKQLNEYEKLESNSSNYSKAVATCEQQVKSAENSITELRGQIKTIFEGTTAELEDKIENWAQASVEKKEQIEEVKQELQAQQDNAKKAQVKLDDYRIREGELLEAEKANDERIASLCDISNKVLATVEEMQDSSEQLQEKISSSSPLSSFVQSAKVASGSVTPEILLRAIQAAIKINQEEYNCLQSRLESEETIMQDKVIALKAEKASAETALAMNRKQKNDLKPRLAELQNRLDTIDGSNDMLAIYEDEEAEIAQKIVNIEKLGLIKKFEDEVEKLSSEIEELDTLAHEAERIKELLMKDQSKTDQISGLKRQKQIKQNECNELIRRSNEHVKNLLGSPMENILDLGPQLNKRIQDLSKELLQKQAELKRKNAQRSVTSAELDQAVKELKKCEKELSDWKKKLEEVMDYDSDEGFDEQYQTIIDDLDEAQKSSYYSEAAEFLFEKQIKQIGKSSCCPTCKQNFKDKQAAKVVQKELEKKIQEVRTTKPEKEKEIEELKVKVSKWNNLKPNYQSKMKLEEDTIPDLRERKETLGKELQGLDEDIEELDILVSTIGSDLSSAQDIVPDVTSYVQNLKEMSRLEDGIKKLDSERNPKAKGLTKSLEEAKAELNGYKDSLSSKRSEMNKKLKLKSDTEKELSKLKAEKNSIQEKKLELMTEVQNKDALLSQKKEYEDANTMLERKIVDLDKQMPSLRNEIAAAQKAKEAFTRNKEAQLEALRSKNDHLLINERSVSEKKKKILDFEKKKAAMDADKPKIQRIKTEAQTLMDQIAASRERLEKLNMEVANHRITERDLKDNLLCKQKQADLRNLRVELAKRQKDLNDSILAGGVVAQKQKLNEQFARAQRKLDEHLGRYHEVKKRKQELEEEIRTDYKHTEEDYQTRLIKVTVYDRAQMDIRKYKKALDHAIMTFHKKRMEAINRTLRSYWNAVYKGNDIEEIQIRTEADNAEAQDKKVNLQPMARKSYNYRVVMIRQGVELDMRGRCSAGQKMLASILIRIALAEAFSAKCGIITLDEPTTNLDSDNIHALAVCLSQLAERMARSKTFQLVVITHDEDFMHDLMEVGSMESFFKVSRNNSGFSRITQVNK